MDVSIIIINYNTFQLTCDCIRSVIAFTEQLEYEVILVDNASSECPPELFLTYFPDLVLIKNEHNLGFAKGNNLGISYAKGRNVLLLNSDTLLTNNVVLPCSHYLDLNPSIGVVTAQLIFPDGKIQSSCQRFPHFKYNLLELLRVQKFFPSYGGRLLLGPFFDYESNCKVDWVWGAFFMFPRRILEQLPDKKLFDGFFMYGEDMWWCWDIRSIGLDTMYLALGPVIHLMGSSGGDKKSEMQKNRQLFLEAHEGKCKINLLQLSEKLLKKTLRSQASR
jgi:GT2 family glycosyltransferase